MPYFPAGGVNCAVVVPAAFAEIYVESTNQTMAGAALGDKLGDIDALGLKLGDSLGDALGDALGLKLGDSLGEADALGLKLGDSLGEAEAENAHEMMIWPTPPRPPARLPAPPPAPPPPG